MKWLSIIFVFVSTSALAQAVCARTTTTLRRGPGNQFEKSWSVTKYMPFVKSEQKNGWIKLSDIDGETHWGRAGDFTQSYRCVAVKVNTLENRQGPGPQFPYADLKTLDRYTPLKRLDIKNGWVWVENDLGQKSWVQESKVWKPVRVESVSF